MRKLLLAKNGEAFPLANIPCLDVTDFLQSIITETASGPSTASATTGPAVMNDSSSG